jgi:hypothetical protein
MADKMAALVLKIFLAKMYVIITVKLPKTEEKNLAENSPTPKIR